MRSEDDPDPDDASPRRPGLDTGPDGGHLRPNTTDGHQSVVTHRGESKRDGPVPTLISVMPSDVDSESAIVTLIRPT